MKLSLLLLLAALGAALITSTDAHAYLKVPAARNYVGFMKGDSYCPHCGQGGGTGKVPGICGDPFQEGPGFSYADKFYGFQATFTEGQVIDTTIVISTNHGGRMHFSVCPLSRGQATQDCFDRPQNKLRRVDSNPLYNNKLYYYLKPGQTEVKAQWRLPSGISCPDGCMLQWWWVGYQSCTLPCESAANDVPGECGTNPLNPPVEDCSRLTRTPPILNTEQFANCADIIITRGAGGGGVVGRSASPPPPPAVAKSSPPPPKKQPPPPAAQHSPPPAPKKSPPPTPVTKKSPPPTPVTKKSPPPHPAPSHKPPAPRVGGAPQCPKHDWRCPKCDSLSKQQKGSLRSTNTKCKTCALTKNANTCFQCYTWKKPASVVNACLNCVVGGAPGWACNEICTKLARTSSQVNQCKACISTKGIDTWGCKNCMQSALKYGSDTATRSDCFKCVQRKGNPWACGQCMSLSKRSKRAACFACTAKLAPGASPSKCLKQ